MPTRVEAPQGLYGLSDILANPAYATGVGLLHWSHRDKEVDGHRTREKKPRGSARDWLGTIGRWFRILLPQ